MTGRILAMIDLFAGAGGPFGRSAEAVSRIFRDHLTFGLLTTAALVALTESLSNPVASVCMHMQGQVIYWRCFQEGELLEQNRRLAEIAQSVTGYYMVNENQTEPSYSNWTILAHSIPTITVETGLSTYPLNTSAMADGIFSRNRDLWVALAYEYANQQ